jgi:hypothetical protein
MPYTGGANRRCTQLAVVVKRDAYYLTFPANPPILHFTITYKPSGQGEECTAMSFQFPIGGECHIVTQPASQSV